MGHYIKKVPRIHCYGCGAHVLNLLARDLQKIDVVSETLRKNKQVAVFFKSHSMAKEVLHDLTTQKLKKNTQHDSGMCHPLVICCHSAPAATIPQTPSSTAPVSPKTPTLAQLATARLKYSFPTPKTLSIYYLYAQNFKESTTCDCLSCVLGKCQTVIQPIISSQLLQSTLCDSRVCVLAVF